MLPRIAADIVVIVHFGFIVFVVLGGLLALRWPRMAWVHVPVAVWGVVIELVGFICPLTPLENRLRVAAGDEGYAGGFIDHYLIPVVYPNGLDKSTQVTLGILVFAVNLAIYGMVVVKRRKARR